MAQMLNNLKKKKTYYLNRFILKYAINYALNNTKTNKYYLN